MTFIHSSASLHCFIFLDIVKFIKILNILDNILKISGKKFSLALHRVEMDGYRYGSGLTGPGYRSGSVYVEMMPIRPDPDSHNRYQFLFFLNGEFALVSEF